MSLVKEIEYFLNEIEGDEYAKFKFGKSIKNLRVLIAKEGAAPKSSGLDALRQIQAIISKELAPRATVEVKPAVEGAPAQPVGKRRGRPPRVAPQA